MNAENILKKTEVTMIRLTVLCSLLMIAEGFAFTQNPTLAGMADNTLMTIPGGGDCGAFAYCREGSSCRTCCESGILDFSSMVYDFHRHKVLAFGGGHATGCFPSNVAELDFATLKWTYNINIDSAGTCATLYATANLLKNAGGSYLGGFTYGGKKYAGSRHSYDGLLMAPDTALMICAEGMDFEGCDGLSGPDYRQGAGLWILDPAARAWSVSLSASLGVTYGWAEADPGQPDWYFVGGGVNSCATFAKINWKTEQRVSLASAPVCDVDMSMTYYPERRSFLAFPTTNLCEYDIARNVWTRLTPSGTVPNCYSLNVCYDTLNKVFCCFYNGDFYYYSPVQNQWHSMGNSFTMARPFHHHIYDPVNNVHIVAGNDGGWQTYAYKFSGTPGKYPGTGMTAVLETGTPAGGGAALSVYPNPCTPATTIRLANGRAGGSAVISVHDVRGKCVDRFQAAHFRLREGLVWEACGLSCGVYLLRVKTAGGEFNRIVFLDR